MFPTPRQRRISYVRARRERYVPSQNQAHQEMHPLELSKNDTCHDEWDKLLDHMIFLWRESAEDTCTRKNSYEEEYDRAHAEFTDKYGFLGKKLRTEEELELDSYRLGCKNEAMDLLKKHFFALWD